MRFMPEGILPAMITPMTREGKVNIAAMRKLIDYLIDGGVDGIFSIGTTGEFYSITDEEYQMVLETTVDQVSGRVPVYAGANSISTQKSIDLVKIADEVGGISAISVLTPFFISLTQKEMYNHFETIAGNTDLSIILYDNSPKTNLTIKPVTVEKLAKIENIVGIKDSTGDLTNTADIILRTRAMNFNVMMGRDSLIYAALAYGATGAVAATANVAPQLVKSIYTRYMEGDLKGSLEAQYQLVPLRIAFGLGSFPTVIKESLELLGIEAGPCIAPTRKMSDEERKELIKILTKMGLLK